MESSERRIPDFCAESEAYDLFRRGVDFLEDGHPAQAAMYLARALAPGARAKLHQGDARPRRVRARPLRDAPPTSSQPWSTDVPDCDYCHYALARSLKALGRGEEARGHLRLARALHPACETYRTPLDGVD